MIVKNRSKILIGLVVLVTLVASTILAFGVLNPTSTSQVQAADTIPVSEYYTPGSFPWGTAFDNQGRVWVALPGCDPAPQCSSSTPPGKIAVFDPNTTSWVKTIQLPAGYGQPLFLDFDSQGRIWFPLPMSNSLGMYDPAQNQVSQWVVPTSASGPWAVAVDGNDKVWFTEHYTNKIASFNPTTQTFQEISTPASNSQPYGITVDAQNNVWFTENVDSVALIAQYTTGGQLKEYKIRNTSTAGSGLTPHLITVDADGNIWWSEGWVTQVGRLIVSQAQPGTNNGVTEFNYLGAGHTSGISADNSGRIWLTDSLLNTFGFIPKSGSSYTFYASGGHPHDGLNVDSQNRIWFDKEFANKIVMAQAPGDGSTPTPTATAIPSPTPTATAEPSPTPTATAEPSPTPTATAEPSPTPTATAIPSPTPTATAIPSPTPTATAIPSPTPTATPLPGNMLAQDTFQRANQPRWGTASDGQTWGGDANVSGSFSISGNTGAVTNTSTSYSAVLGPAMANANVEVTGSINKFTYNNFGPVTRWTDGNNWYKAYIDGSKLIIQKKVNGVTSTLVSVPFAAQVNTQYKIRFQVSGTTLSAKAWLASGSEPANWMTTATDGSLSSGQCGLRLLAQGATITINTFTVKPL
jgi:streptogramin lyase